jgi:hypothetical protein
MDLSLSHFGASLLFAGSDSGPDHVAVTFGDRDFHMGLAEAHLGWLLELGMAQCGALRVFEGVFAAGDTSAVAAFERKSATWLANPSRCHVELIEVGGVRRYLVQNWRREPRSAAKRMLL